VEARQRPGAPRDEAAGPPRDREGRPGPNDAARHRSPREEGFDRSPAPWGREGRGGPEGQRLGPPALGDREGPPGPEGQRFGPPAPGDREGPPGQEGRRFGPPPPWPYRSWESLEKSDPELFKAAKADGDLDRMTRELAMQYRQAPAAERERIQKEVEKAVAQQFEVRQQLRTLELKRLESNLQRLHASLEARAKARDQLIHKRVSELLGRDDEAGF
jgi:hypothetical protein